MIDDSINLHGETYYFSDLGGIKRKKQILDFLWGSGGDIEQFCDSFICEQPLTLYTIWLEPVLKNILNMMHVHQLISEPTTTMFLRLPTGYTISLNNRI